MACLNDDVETVSTLLEHGADVEEKNDVRKQMIIMIIMVMMMMMSSQSTYVFQLNMMYK